MASVKLENIYKKYDGNDEYSVKDVSIDIEDGAFAVFVGPSGCGKSTTLRMIAGLEKITDGKIYIGDRLVNDVEPGDRKVAMVFQNYALYPTMTVRENIEFGLINNKVPKDERDRLIKEISEIVSLDKYMDRRPSNLSGGQRQRVALARAMVKKPDLFILDEPLSNLDAKLRVAMRVQLKRIHEQLGTTFIYVTHDQVEAMSMGTQIIVMNNGSVMQDATPEEIYRHPENVFTAKFIGSPPMNVVKLDDDKKKFFDIKDPRVSYLGFRPEDIKIVDKKSSNNSLSFIAKIISVEPLGSETIYTLESKFGFFQMKSFDKQILKEGEVICEIKDEYVKYFDQNEAKIVDPKIKNNTDNILEDNTLVNKESEVYEVGSSNRENQESTTYISK